MTKVPDVVSAIVTAFDAATTVPVLRGASLAASLPPEYVMVEVAESGPGVRVTRERVDRMRQPTYRESWAVGCLMVVSSGGSDLAALETSAAATLTALDSAVRGAARTAWVDAGIEGELRWGALHTVDGAQVGVIFEVRGWSWL